MKKILIPTDFSDNAWDAFTYAIRLYEDVAAQFYILHTYHVGSSQMSDRMHQQRNTKIFRAIEEDTNSEMAKWQAMVNENLDNDKHQFLYLTRLGDLVTNINQLVSKKNIDLIIMGTAGATGAKEIFLGSNATKLIHEISLCPILSIPKDYEYKDLSRVVLATDLKKPLDINQLNVLIELRQLFNFSVEIVKVSDNKKLSGEQEQNSKIIESVFAEKGITLNLIDKKEKSIAKTIQNYTAEHTDLICMVNYEHSFIERLTNEAIVKKISLHSMVPLLVIPI